MQIHVHLALISHHTFLFRVFDSHHTIALTWALTFMMTDIDGNLVRNNNAFAKGSRLEMSDPQRRPEDLDYQLFVAICE